MNDIAVVIIETETDDAGNFIPCIVKEGVTGYYRTNWTWGKDKALAEECAKDYNRRLGLSDEDAIRLVLRSMGESNVETEATMRIEAYATVSDAAMESLADEMNSVLEQYAKHRSLAWKKLKAHEPEDRVVIVIEGGIVNDVISSKPLSVLVLDNDIDGCEEENIVDIEGEEYVICRFDSTWETERAQKRISDAFKAVSER